MLQLSTIPAVVVAVGLAFIFLRPPERIHPPGQVAPREPVQTEIGRGDRIKMGAFGLDPRARYRLTARVLSRERYFIDAMAAISPIDFALGWGEMSDTRVIGKLHIDQGRRWYSWQFKSRQDAVAVERIALNSANTHLIPATPEVRAALFAARVGDVVELEGLLVDVYKNDRFLSATSLTRDDTGGGACEIMYVRSVVIQPAATTR